MKVRFTSSSFANNKAEIRQTPKLKSAFYRNVDSFNGVALKAKPVNNNVLTFVGQKLKEKLDSLTLIYTTDTHRNLSRMPNLKTAIDKFRNSSDDSLTIHAGDYGNGMRGLNLHVKILNALGIDYATLGNHEFISRSDGLAKALKNTEFQTVISNLTIPEENPLNELLQSKKIVPSVIKEIKCEKYGFIGATTTSINNFSKVLGGLKAVDPEEVIEARVKELEAQGVNRIILISHLGYIQDKEMAKIPGIDVIVGGHRHYAIPGIKKDINLFETERKEPVLILHGGAHNHYLGVSHLVFNNNGILQIKPDTGSLFSKLRQASSFALNKLSFWRNNSSKELTSTNKLHNLKYFSQDKEIKAIVDKAYSDMHFVANIKKNISTDWPIWKSTEIGSLIADAVKDVTSPKNDNTPPTEIAFIQSECFKRGIKKGPLHAEYIEDFVIPFNNKLVKASLSGNNILEILNKSASYVNGSPKQGLLQVSGLKYSIDFKQPEDVRVLKENVMVKTARGYEPLDLNKDYIIAVDRFLYKGNNGYEDFKNSTLIKEYDSNYAKALIKYIEEQPERIKATKKDYKNRITLINSPKEPFSFKKVLSWFGIEIGKDRNFIICAE